MCWNPIRILSSWDFDNHIIIVVAAFSILGCDYISVVEYSFRGETKISLKLPQGFYFSNQDINGFFQLTSTILWRNRQTLR